MAVWRIQARTPVAASAWTTVAGDDDANGRHTGLRFRKDINQLWSMSASLWRMSAAQLVKLAIGNEIRVTVDGTEKWRGEVREIDDNPMTTEFTVKALDKAVILMDRPYNFRTQFSVQAAEDIVDAILKDEDTAYILPGGLLASSFDEIGFRAEIEERLAIIDNIAQAIGAEWYVDRNGGPDQDRFRFVSRIGLAGAQDTFQIGVTIRDIKRFLDVETVRNDVEVLGVGDGANQLRSRIFDASLDRTTLSADYSATATTPIPVSSSTGFPSSGIVFIGAERVRYVGTAAGQLGSTSVTRAYDGDLPGKNRNTLAAYAHESGIAVWLHADESGPTVYFDPQAPETGSSIQVNGWRADVYVDKAIIDQDTLDRLAQRLLASYNAPRDTIQLRVTEDDIAADIGDDVAVLTQAGAPYGSSPYRIFAMEFVRDRSEWIFDLGSPFDLAQAELARLRDDMRIERAYGQGSSNFYMFSERGYIQNGTDEVLLVDIDLPTGVVASTVLIENLRMTPVGRMWAGGIQGGGLGVTDVGETVVAPPVSSWTNVHTAVAISAYPRVAFGYIVVTVKQITASAEHLVDFRAQIAAPSAATFNTASHRHMDEVGTQEFVIPVFDNRAGVSKAVTLEIFSDLAGLTFHVESTFIPILLANRMDLPPGGPSVDVLIDGTDRTSALGGPFTTNQTDIDISEFVTATGPHTVEFRSGVGTVPFYIRVAISVDTFIRA